MTAHNPPERAVVFIDEMLDLCAKVQPGHEVLILAHSDGLTPGSANEVDPQVIDWIQAAVKVRGANPTVLWIDEPDRPVGDWPVPPVLKAAIAASDVLISHSLHFNVEDLFEFRKWGNAHKVVQVRNFATTAKMMVSDWAYTPFELVAEIRYRMAQEFKVGLPWTLTHGNGTHLEGTVAWGGAPDHPTQSYAFYRTDDFYRPFPDWVTPPIMHGGVTGVMIVDRGYSWWTRFIGIDPWFEEPMRIEVENGMITALTGGREAELTTAFIKEHLEPQVGEKAWMFTRMHAGIHPNAHLSETECPNVMHRRMVDQAWSKVIHMHIGHGIKPDEVDPFPYGLHITGDIENATWEVDGKVLIDRGRNMLFDDPDIRALVRKYPGRPALGRSGENPR